MKENVKIDGKKFWLGALLALAGVAMLFVAMFISPVGEIHNSVLGAAGEVFVLAGSLTAADSYLTYKIHKILNNKE